MLTKDEQTKIDQNKLQKIQNDKRIDNSGTIRNDAHVSSLNKRAQSKKDDRSLISK